MSHGKIVGIMVVLDHGNPRSCNNFSNHTGAKLETYQIISADGMAKKKNSLMLLKALLPKATLVF